MKWRVIDLNDGEEAYAGYECEFYLDTDGKLLRADLSQDTVHFVSMDEYTLDFAFSKDDQGEWIWSHSVVND